MIDINQYLHDIKQAQSVEEAFSVLQRHLLELGIDRTVYSLMTDFRTIGLPAGHAILGNYPEDWMAYYRENGYEDVDPVRKILMQTNEPFKWSDLERFRDIQKGEHHLMEEARDAKLYNGIGLGLHCPRGEVIGMGFASSERNAGITEDAMRMIRIMANEFHYVFMNLNAHRFRRNPCMLTPREIEVLLWIARGKNAPEISRILSADGSLSEATVRFHIRNIYAKLEVTSTTQAMGKALAYGLLTFADLNGYV